MSNQYFPPTHTFPNMDGNLPDFNRRIDLQQWSQQIPSAVQPVSTPKTFKPKRAGTKTSHVVFILDESSSMHTCKAQTISGFNEYLDMQKADQNKTGIPTFVSLYKFNGSTVDRVYDRAAIDVVNHIGASDYTPNGMTNLYDAIGRVMNLVNKKLKNANKSNRDSVIINILTDGAENSSMSFDQSTIKEMVSLAETKNWGFTFIGANIDAFATGGKLGFRESNTLQFGTENMNETMLAASAMSGRMRSAYASGMSTELAYADYGFNDAERASAIKGDDK